MWLPEERANRLRRVAVRIDFFGGSEGPRDTATAPPPVVLIPSWEQLVVGNLSDKLGAFWELVIGSDASARSLGIGWEPGSQKKVLVAWEP
jgi:hypothetical protein